MTFQCPLSRIVTLPTKHNIEAIDLHVITAIAPDLRSGAMSSLCLVMITTTGDVRTPHQYSEIVFLTRAKMVKNVMLLQFISLQSLLQ